MIAKLQKALDEPRWVLEVLKNRCLRLFFPEKLFVYTAEYRSASEGGEYVAAVNRFLKSQRAFDHFKRDLTYRRVLEHVTKAQGQAYLNVLKERDDGLLSEALGSVLLSDSVGNPVKYDYEGVDVLLSPTTLRYLKVASDLRSLFGRGLEEVVEIGCGYGGQCLVNERLLGYRRSTLFDLPFVNELIKRYLNGTLMDGAYRTVTINESLPQPYDLVISNYAFSELPKALQQVYINKVIANAKRGYLTMNSGIGGDMNAGKLSLKELRERLPAFEVLEEEPATASFNYIIVWGHDREGLEKNFVKKKA